MRDAEDLAECVRQIRGDLRGGRQRCGGKDGVGGDVELQQYLCAGAVLPAVAGVMRL